MKIMLDISQNILEQFRCLFGTSCDGESDSLEMSPEVGVGQMELIAFPGQLEFYHYWSTLKQTLTITSTNPDSSKWYGLIINLSNAEVVKSVGATEISIQRLLPSGMLLYPPDSIVRGTSQPDQRSESVFIRFHQSFLEMYFSTGIDLLRQSSGSVLYEDLDYLSETLLRELIQSKSDKLAAHSKALSFMRTFLDKIEARGTAKKVEKWHPDDLRGLYRAAATLRNPVASAVPSVRELAELAQMGDTKFKTVFRAVFGVAPLQYHRKIRMEYARDALLAGARSPSDLSYELGYSHPSKFTAAFKKRFKQLPSQVRGTQVRL
jgi:AraC-like DNA-binding protein